MPPKVDVKTLTGKMNNAVGILMELMEEFETIFAIRPGLERLETVFNLVESKYRSVKKQQEVISDKLIEEGASSEDELVLMNRKLGDKVKADFLQIALKYAAYQSENSHPNVPDHTETLKTMSSAVEKMAVAMGSKPSSLERLTVPIWDGSRRTIRRGKRSLDTLWQNMDKTKMSNFKDSEKQCRKVSSAKSEKGRKCVKPRNLVASRQPSAPEANETMTAPTKKNVPTEDQPLEEQITTQLTMIEPLSKKMAKTITSKCVTCRKLRKRPLNQLLGQIPNLKVAAGFPAFPNTAMDMFGPIQIKLGRKTLKEAQVIIFTCMTSRAIHLELVTNKTSDAFFMAFRRFACLRGYPIVCSDREKEAPIYENLGTVFQFLGDCHKAKEYCKKVLTVETEIGDREGEATSYVNLGTLFQSLGEYQKAKECCEKALTVATEIGHREGEAARYGNLGAVFQSLGEYPKAKEYREKALTIAIEIGDREGQATSYGNLGAVFQFLGEYQKAKEYFEKALTIATEIGDRQGEATSYGNFGAVFQSLSDYQKAKEYCEKTLTIAIETGDRQGEATSYGNLGTVFQSLGEYQKAKECHKKALDIAIVIGYGRSYDGLGTVYIFLGEYQRAEECHEKALTISKGINDRQGEGVCYRSLESMFESLGEYKKAKRYYKKALFIASELGEREGPADYHNKTGALVVGDTTAGKVHYGGSVRNFKALFCASKETEMVGQVLRVQPLSRRRAIKQAVIREIPSVSLIHLTAHGNAERGEIALSPRFTTNSIPQKEDYLPTISRILGVQVRAKLVVLSYCHSGRGTIKKEGVLGIARAFLASGARSVLVASWAMEDEETAKLMKHFYQNLARGESVSESFHQAVQLLRNNSFPKPCQWAPFVLIGDNVTFDFTKRECQEGEADFVLRFEPDDFGESVVFVNWSQMRVAFV
ncbi:G-protein-signaling modulator 2 [Stylophora pistillata]|uniref:G-protein-signaling modulator 2 n=1 Tax=Stylophora pistillata TaxID=50429 RepID=A0A2B4RY81_STYPI|nr:G-protein-signaling modulator 2 [Stylophora pistillata]